MPIFDLADAKPIEGFRQRSGSKRTLGDPGTVPSALMGGTGGTSGGFAAAKINRLTMDFIGRNVSADQDLFGSSLRLRARARELAQNNGHFIKFLAEVEQNIVGETGIGMQAKVTNDSGRQTAETKRINFRIQQEWKRWGKRGRCTADRGYSWADLQRMAVRTVAGEGESIVKHVYGMQFNAAGFALQPLDNDQLDDTMMQDLGNGGAIRMGVEVDSFGAPDAYHLFSGHPNDMQGRNRVRVRVPADQVTHAFVRRRPAQRRGYTWASGAILDLNMLARYEEAVIVAARASAAKFMVVQQAETEGYTGEDDEAGSLQETAGGPAMSANAGEAMVLDPGQTAKFIDPRFPTNNHRDFLRTKLRSIATGLLMDYPSLGNDLEGVNFSSIRAGLLDIRDSWRILQRWFVEHFVEPIFQAWLRMALLTVLSDITLTEAQMEQITWHARGWDWVDPLKDSQANALDIQNAFTTHSRVLAAKGLDLEDIVQELAAEQALFKAAGITVGTDIQGVADTADDTPDENDPDADKPDSKPKRLFSLRYQVTEERSPAQIRAAIEAYRTRTFEEVTR